MFTAPIAGAYAFHFHALTRDGTATYIKLMHNGRNVGGAYRRHAGEADENHEESLHVSCKKQNPIFISIFFLLKYPLSYPIISLGQFII